MLEGGALLSSISLNAINFNDAGRHRMEDVWQLHKR